MTKRTDLKETNDGKYSGTHTGGNFRPIETAFKCHNNFPSLAGTKAEQTGTRPSLPGTKFQVKQNNKQTGIDKRFHRGNECEASLSVTSERRSFTELRRSYGENVSHSPPVVCPVTPARLWFAKQRRGNSLSCFRKTTHTETETRTPSKRRSTSPPPPRSFLIPAPRNTSCEIFPLFLKGFATIDRQSRKPMP